MLKRAAQVLRGLCLCAIGRKSAPKSSASLPDTQQSLQSLTPRQIQAMKRSLTGSIQGWPLLADSVSPETTKAARNTQAPVQAGQSKTPATQTGEKGSAQ